MSVIELGVRSAAYRPTFNEFILAVPDLPSDEVQSQQLMRRLVISAAKLGKRSLEELVFVGLDGASAVLDGTFHFPSNTDIEGMTNREWNIAAQSGSTEGLPFGTPAEEATICSELPTVAALDRNRLAESIEPDHLYWYLIKDKANDPMPLFEDAVISAVYIPDTFDQIHSLQKRLGVPNNHIFDGQRERWGLGNTIEPVVRIARQDTSFSPPSLFLVR